MNIESMTYNFIMLELVRLLFLSYKCEQDYVEASHAEGQGGVWENKVRVMATLGFKNDQADLLCNDCRNLANNIVSCTLFKV